MGKNKKRPRESNDAKNENVVESQEEKKKDDGISEIDFLFADKKQKKKEEEEKIQEELKKAKKQKSMNAGSKRDGKKKICLKYDRSDISNLKTNDWVDDGLGGVFNNEGFTGRKDSTSGFKVYKAHLFNKKGFGETKDCPFDCDCCFI